MTENLNSIREDSLLVAGSAAWSTYLVRLYGDYSNLSCSERDRVILHELLHYFQLTCTLDGASWYFHGIQWTDSIRDAIKSKKGKIPIPILKDIDSCYSEAVRKFKSFHADERLFIYGDPSLCGLEVEPPVLKLAPDFQESLTNRYLYEGFARLNERIGITKLKGSDAAHKIYKELPFLPEYDWPYVFEEYSGIDILTILVVIDLALMRPIANWGKYDAVEVVPGWRFIKAIEFVKNRSLSITLASVSEIQDLICEGLGWTKPNQLIRDTLRYAEMVKESFLWKRDVIDPSKVEDRHIRENASGGNFCTCRRIEQIVCALNFRLDTEFSNAFFITPIVRMDLFSEKFYPKEVILENGFGGFRSSTELGMSMYHPEKIRLSNELINSHHVTCIIKQHNIGECPFDKECPGIFPRLDGNIPDCPFNELFRGIFGHDLGDIEVI